VVGQVGLGAIFSLVFVGVVGAGFMLLTVARSAALYRYAATGEGAPGFDAQALRLAFAPK
jgi:hypothetical protein